MSKYTEIAELASQRSQEFFDELRKCEVAAVQIASRLQASFEVPEEHISFVELDRDLVSTQEVLSFGSKPKLTLGQDAFWYFGLRIHFESSARSAFEDLTLKIGIKASASSVTIRFHQDFEASTTNELDQFLSYLHRDLIEHYSAPRSKRTGRPGFIE